MALVCVTGATGFVATHVIENLLQKGYKVRGTVRNSQDSKKNAHLIKLGQKYSGNGSILELVDADLLKDGSFDKAVEGCEYVIHTASPATETSSNPMEEIIKPAVQGTLNVLESAKKFPTVKTVVITSSTSAILPYSKKNIVPGKVYNEEDWNTDSSLEIGYYNYSKVQAEKAAWKFVEELPDERKFKLVVINPSLCVGPIHTAGALNISSSVIMSYVDGKYPAVPRFSWNYVDVRDVAEAHVLAFENKNANGRYCIVGETYWMRDTAKIIKQKYPHLPVPTWQMPNFVMYLAPLFDSRLSYATVSSLLDYEILVTNEKAKKELGIKFRPVDQAIFDAIDSFVEFGLVPKKP